MVVEILNITDSPQSKVKPTQVDIYTRTLDPGEALKLPAELVDERLRKLEDGGYIAIGQAPSWYAASKAKKGKPLSPEELRKRLAPKRTPVLYEGEQPAVETEEPRSAELFTSDLKKSKKR